MKYCTGCKTEKPLQEFWKNKSVADGLQAWCKPCWKAVTAKRRNGPKRESELRQRRNRHLVNKYGITIDDYEKKLLLQKGVCGICFMRRSERHSLAVDHDHKTGEVRGILCENCNRGIGMFMHDLTLLENAITYLKTCKW